MPTVPLEVEAADTAIWFTDVASRTEIDCLRTLNAEANPDLLRIAFKPATGSGKTTVMAMLIAWQALNAARARNSLRFADAFPIVAPGITVRDRLRVLLPSDPNDTYTLHDIELREMLDDLSEDRTVITNLHPFQRRSRRIGDRAAERLYRASAENAAGAGSLRSIMNAVNEVGSSRHLNFVTPETNFWTPRTDRCQINLVGRCTTFSRRPNATSPRRCLFPVGYSRSVPRAAAQAGNGTYPGRRMSKRLSGAIFA